MPTRSSSAVEPLVELYEAYRQEKIKADEAEVRAQKAFDRNDDLFWHEKLDLDLRDARGRDVRRPAGSRSPRLLRFEVVEEHLEERFEVSGPAAPAGFIGDLLGA